MVGYRAASRLGPETAKTIVASPRGPNHPMKSLSAALVRVLIKHRKTGSILTTRQAEGFVTVTIMLTAGWLFC